MKNIIAVSCAVNMSLSLAAYAQTTASTPRDNDVGILEEVVVTAQRRTENLQSVPIAISAFSSETMENAGVVNTTDLPLLTPGLYMGQGVGIASPYLRGVGSRSNGTGTENPVAMYVDDVYLPFKSGTIQSLSDVARVAVLKGPQGTLFGRNATGGLIQITTKEPTRELTGDVKLGFANFQTTEASTYISGGLGENVSASLSGFNSSQDEGWGDNPTTGLDVNKTTQRAIRGKLVFDPTNTKVSLIGDWSSIDTDVGLNYRPLHGSTPSFGPPFTLGDYDAFGNYRPGFKAENWGVSAKVDHDFGRVQLTNITAYRRTDVEIRLDQDVSPLDALNGYGLIDEEAISEEFRLATETNFGLKIQGGVFLFDASGDQDFRLFGFLAPVIFGGANPAITHAHTKTRSYAAYIEGTQELSQTTRLTLGARHTYEKRRIMGSRVAVTSGGTFGTDTIPQSMTDEAPTWRVAIDHDFSENILGYLSYNRGFKTGGYNPTSPSAPGYMSESLDAYEAGIKSESFGQRVRVNVGGFYYRYSDIQLNNYVLGVQTTINAAKAELYGLDVDIQAKVTSQLTLLGSFALLHTEFLDYPDAPGAIPAAAGGYEIVPIDATGFDLPNAPKFSGNIGFDYVVPMGAGELFLNNTVSYVDKFFTEPNNVMEQSGYTLWNSKLGWRLSNGMSFSIWGRNLGNASYATTKIAQAVGAVTSLAAPRTYGATFEYQF